MGTFDKKLGNDNLFCGGLIAIGIAWVAFSAVQAAGIGMTREARPDCATGAPATLSATAAAARATALPANDIRTAAARHSQEG